MGFGVVRDATPPTLTLEAPVRGTDVHVTWNVEDSGSGLDAGTCLLEVRDDEGTWQTFSTECGGEDATHDGQPGHTYTFHFSASDNVGNEDILEVQAVVPYATKHYYANGQRVAMQKEGVVYYVHTDHLGSTTLTTCGSQDGCDGTPYQGVVARQLYHPYGEVRWSEGTLPTDYGFTGQRLDSYTRLYQMGTRWYDPQIGRWISPDTIIPDPANPQSFNRYSYTYNRPLVLRDPDGHDPIGTLWTLQFWAAHGRLPNDVDWQDRLFSLMFPGTGASGSWTADDWDFYSTHRDDLWAGSTNWRVHEEPGLNRFETHVARLASHYRAGEEDWFVRAAGLVWGGIPYTGLTSWALVIAGAGRSDLAQLYEGNAGWDERLVDDRNPAHQWAGGFVGGWNFHKWGGKAFNRGREFLSVVLGQPGSSMDDVWLGNIAAQEANALWHDTHGLFQGSAPMYSLLVQMDEDLRFAGPTTCVFCQVSQIFWDTPAPP